MEFLLQRSAERVEREIFAMTFGFKAVRTRFVFSGHYLHKGKGTTQRKFEHGIVDSLVTIRITVRELVLGSALWLKFLHKLSGDSPKLP
jgi:hypothetical protein